MSPESTTSPSRAGRAPFAAALLLALALAAAALFAAPASAWAADDDIASGTSGGCTWVIDADGALTVSPTDGESGTLGRINTAAKVPWTSYRSQITSVVIEDGVKAQSFVAYLFRNCSSLVSADLSGLDLSEADDFSHTFYGCSSLTTVELSGLDTSQVSDISYFFYGCSSLQTVDLSGFNTENVADMQSLFYGCSSLVSADLSSFDTSSAWCLKYLFKGCSALESVDVSSFDTTAATTIQGMFDGCSSLSALDISNFDVSGLSGAGLSEVFADCTGLRTVTLGAGYTFPTSVYEGYLPLPVEDGVEGWWINEATGEIYTDPADIPSLTAATYVAMFPEVSEEDESTDEGSTDDGSTDDGAADDGATDEGATDDGAAEDGATDEGATDDGATDDGAADDGATDDGTTDDESADGEEGESEAESEEEPVYQFTDVQDPELYYFDAVYALADADIINGVSDTLYGVNQNMTRAQFATIIWRIAGEPATDYDAGYSDVAEGKYYSEAINWAAENEVVKGYTNGSYGINDTLSFEDMCLIIARYANGGDEALQASVTDEAAAEVLAAFADGDAVSAYADKGMAWCISEGFVEGNTDGTIVPQENVTRQRAAVVVARWQGLVD